MNKYRYKMQFLGSNTQSPVIFFESNFLAISLNEAKTIGERLGEVAIVNGLVPEMYRCYESITEEVKTTSKKESPVFY